MYTYTNIHICLFLIAPLRYASVCSSLRCTVREKIQPRGGDIGTAKAMHKLQH